MRTCSGRHKQEVISTGRPELDRHLGKGIPRGSLALIGGGRASGKSVLCQHLAYSALRCGGGVAYYTSDDQPLGLLKRMGQLGMDVEDYFLLDRLRVYPVELSEFHPRPPEILDVLGAHLAGLPPEMGVVVIDALTPLLSRCPGDALSRFFARCRWWCDTGKTVLVVVDPTNTVQSALQQLYPWCHVYLRLKLEVVLVERVVKSLEVRKTPWRRGPPGKGVNFEVHPGRGIHVITGGGQGGQAVS